MRLNATLLLSICALAGTAVSAENDVLDCSHRSLAHAVKNADANQTIRFTGVCAGPIVIQRNGITLKGVGSAAIDGGGSEPVTTPAPAVSRSPTSKSGTASTASSPSTAPISSSST
jgi:hypothetical protein